MSRINVTRLNAEPGIRRVLSEMLVEAVANEGLVNFMHPLPLETADAFWDAVLAAASRDECIVLGAFDGGQLVGTLTLLLDMPPNQPHRAELSKLMTRVSHRGCGVATALMREAERNAIARGRALLVLTTADEVGPSSLYEGLGFTLAGVIPRFGAKPFGGLVGCKFYWKWLGEEPSQ